MPIQRLKKSCGRRVLVECAGPEFLARGQTTALRVIGCASLAAGVLVYLSERSPSHALLVPVLAPLSGQQLFGAIGLWLPSFVHPLAFSLFSAALLALQPRWRYGACAFWFGVNAAFEVGQHPQVRGPLAEAVRQGLGQGPVARAFENYFLRGTFDLGDLIAAALGAALAACILRLLCVHRENCHAH